MASGEHMSTYTIPSVVTDAIKVRHNGGWGVLVKTAGIYAVQICHQKNKKYIIHLTHTRDTLTLEQSGKMGSH